MDVLRITFCSHIRCGSNGVYDVLNSHVRKGVTMLALHRFSVGLLIFSFLHARSALFILNCMWNSESEKSSLWNWKIAEQAAKKSITTKQKIVFIHIHCYRHHSIRSSYRSLRIWCVFAFRCLPNDASTQSYEPNSCPFPWNPFNSH